MNWIFRVAESHLILTGARIQLPPLHSSDASALIRAASDGELWNLPFTVVATQNTVQEYIDKALDTQEQGIALPFVPLIRETGQIIGTTRFLKIDEKNLGV